MEVSTMSADFCPSCGEAWEGECPKDPWYRVYTCENCGRVEGDNYGRKETIREGKDLSPAQWAEVARLEAEWAQQEEEEGDGN